MSDLSAREFEQNEMVGNIAQQELEDIDIKVAKVAPDIWLTAGIVREYYDALKATFKDDDDNPMLSGDQILKIVIGTVGHIRLR